MKGFFASLLAVVFIFVTATAGADVFAAEFGGSFEYLAGTIELRETPLNPSNALGLASYAGASELKAFLASDDKTTMMIDGRALNDSASKTSSVALDQAYLSFGVWGPLSVKAGRQRLGFGAGYLWNPVNDLDVKKDVYNPSKYTQGIDALALKLDAGNLTGLQSSLQLQMIPPSETSGRPEDISRSALAAQLYMLTGAFELGAAASMRKISASSSTSHIGFYSTVDVMGSVLGAECALSRRPDYPSVSPSGAEYSDEAKPQFLVNFNRRTSEKSFLVVEYHYNAFGFDANDFENAAVLLRSSYTANAPLLSAYLSPGYAGRNNIFATFSGEASPDVTMAVSVMYGADTASGFLYPRISWSGARNLTVSLEYISNFSSARPSEYTLAAYSSAAFLRAIYYF